MVNRIPVSVTMIVGLRSVFGLLPGDKKHMRKIDQKRITIQAQCCNCKYEQEVEPKVIQWNGLDSGRNRYTMIPDVWICSDCMEGILSRQ